MMPNRKRSRYFSIAKVVCGLTCLYLIPGQSALAQEEPAKDEVKEKGSPASVSGFSDEGVFYLFQNETRIATINHHWTADGALLNNSTLSVGGQHVESELRIPAAPDGRWAGMTMDTSLGKVDVVREGENVRITFRGKTDVITLKPNTLIFENFTPVLMSQAIRAYDRTTGGKQQFPVFVIPRTVVDMSVEFGDKVERTVAGRDMEFYKYNLLMAGIDIIVWADESAKVYLAEVPVQHVAYLREGYASLLMKPETDPLLSKPQFEVVEQRGTWIPMRDSVRLSTDVYLPKKVDKSPTILIRTPYKKEMVEVQAKYYARRGYSVAVQDCRGRFASEGTWEPFVNEPKDGYDAIEWLAKQPWSTGKIGMIGGSYLGWVQWWAASEHPPHLTTIIPNVSPPDPFYNIPYEYGVFFLYGSIWWADILETEATGDLSGAALYEIGEKKFGQLLRPLPVIDLDVPVLGKKNPYWRKWIEHNTNDSYWARSSFLDRLADVRIPVFHQSGWFDGDGIGTKLNYLRMRADGHPNQKLIIGPWVHTTQAHRMLGDHDFGAAAVIDLQREYLRWFDYWLKGVKNGMMDEPLVKVFIMGKNEWLTGNTYPVEQTRMEKWYLVSGGQANTLNGDGKLSRTVPAADSKPDRFQYNPGDPTPSPHFFEEPDTDEYNAKTVTEKKKVAKAYHESVTKQRSDILVYATDPLTEPLTFAGPMSAVLYASSSAKDTDWFVRVMEVDDTGEIFMLAEGKLRARFHESMSQPEMLTPGKVYSFQVDLWQTGIEVPKGHRLRVEVASASFPLFSRNLNTGGHNEMDTKYVTADQTIYHDAEHASYILLPVIPQADSGSQP